MSLKTSSPSVFLLLLLLLLLLLAFGRKWKTKLPFSLLSLSLSLPPFSCLREKLPYPPWTSPAAREVARQAAMGEGRFPGNYAKYVWLREKEREEEREEKRREEREKRVCREPDWLTQMRDFFGGGDDFLLPPPASSSFPPLFILPHHGRSLNSPGDLMDTRPISAASLMTSNVSEGITEVFQVNVSLQSPSCPMPISAFFPLTTRAWKQIPWCYLVQPQH